MTAMRRNMQEPARRFVEQLGGTIRDLRREQGLHQHELGARCGIKGSRVGEIERGVVVTSISRLRAIAAALGISTSLLLRRWELAFEGERQHSAQRESLARSLRSLGAEELDLVLTILARLPRTSRRKDALRAGSQPPGSRAEATRGGRPRRRLPPGSVDG